MAGCVGVRARVESQHGRRWPRFGPSGQGITRVIE